MQAIILCGGKGTRLKGALPEGTPKAMAYVSGRPFLCYLLEYWESFITSFILVAGHGKNQIQKYFGDTFCTSKLIYKDCTDGTSAAVNEGLGEAMEEEVFVINGDTYWEINPYDMLVFHQQSGAQLTLGYSSAAGIHAGVDILEVRPRYHTRGAIFTHSGYFNDIGTPESLAKFREHIKNEDTGDLQHNGAGRS